MLSLRTFLSILILSGYVVSQTDKIEYDGPERSNYFRQTFNESISNLESLSCGNYMTDSTSLTNPVKYYTFHITSNTKPIYKSLIITTCCYNITSSYCNNSSLDTIVYIVQQRKGQIRLLSTIQSYNIDDIQCSTNPNKQSVEMIDYYQGEYIIGIGGYGNQYGSYNISIECSLLSESSPNHIIGIIIFAIIAIIIYLFAIKYILSAFGQLFCKKDDAVSLIINNDKSSNVKYNNLDISSVLDECISALKDEDGLDIYQALAVQSSGISFNKWCDSQSVSLQWKGDMNEIKTLYGGSHWLLTKAIIAFLIQIIILGWITYRLLENQLIYHGNHPAFCDGFPNIRDIVMSLLLGFAITAYVCVQYAKSS